MICIYGTGGFAIETFLSAIDGLETTPLKPINHVCFMVDDEYLQEDEIMGVRVIPVSRFDPSTQRCAVAIGDPQTRKSVVERLPEGTRFASIRDLTAVVPIWNGIGYGAIIRAGVIFTCAIRVGKHAHFNLHTSIGHNTVIGDYFTAAPGVRINGHTTIGDCVYLGSNVCLRERVTICDNVTVGMGSVVLNDITEPGTYVGNPLRRLNKKREVAG